MDLDDGGDDAGLQPERTTLAWARTGVAATTAAVVTARVAIARGSLLIAASAGVVSAFALAGLIVSAAGHTGRRQWFQQQRPSHGLPLMARMTVTVTIALCVIGVLLVTVTS